MVQILRLTFTLLMSSLLQVAGARAHEVTPTIGDLSVQDGTLRLELRLNLEAFLAGIDLDGLADTDDTEQTGDYDLLRGLPQSELEPMVDTFSQDWLETLEVTVGARVAMSVSDLQVPAVGPVDLPRASILVLEGALPQATGSVTLHWPSGSGGLVLRQQGVEDPYTGFLQGGESSPPIPLRGGANLTARDAFIDYIPVGFEHIIPLGWDHILFVLGLFFLSRHLRPLIWQISAFTVAHTVTLALGALGYVTVPASIVEPLIAASIVYVAIENVLTNHLHRWRPVVIFAFGLLHGLGFASVLGDFGLPTEQFLPALIGFNIGVELGQLTVIAIAWISVGFWFRNYPKYRGRVAIPASITIAAIGTYWFVERVFL